MKDPNGKYGDKIQKIKDKMKSKVEVYEKWRAEHRQEGIKAFILFKSMDDAKYMSRLYKSKCCQCCQKPNPERRPIGEKAQP